MIRKIHFTNNESINEVRNRTDYSYPSSSEDSLYSPSICSNEFSPISEDSHNRNNNLNYSHASVHVSGNKNKALSTMKSAQIKKAIKKNKKGRKHKNHGRKHNKNAVAEDLMKDQQIAEPQATVPAQWTNLARILTPEYQALSPSFYKSIKRSSSSHQTFHDNESSEEASYSAQYEIMHKMPEQEEARYWAEMDKQAMEGIKPHKKRRRRRRRRRRVRSNTDFITKN